LEMCAKSTTRRDIERFAAGERSMHGARELTTGR
jgi:hypothetical protein